MTGYLRTLVLFYRRSLRVQPLRELMAVFGVAAGVALLFTVQVAHNSITGSFQQISHGVAGHATLEIAARSPEGFDERIVSEVEHIPTVKAAAPIFTVPVIATGPGGRESLALLGANEQIDALGGNLSRSFERVAETSSRGLLVLTEPTAHRLGLKTGSSVSLLVGQRTEHLNLDGTVSRSSLGAAAESPIAASALAIVQSLSGLPGRVSRLLIEPRPGSEAVLRHNLSTKYASTLNVRPVDTEAQLLSNVAGPEKQITLLFSAISLVAGIIIAYNALLLASEERRRFIIGLIRLGTPDSMIFASLAFDALVLGLAGSLVGLLAGDGISTIAYRSVPGYIAAAFSIGGQRVIDVQTVLLGLAGGLLAAFIAAGLPASAILRGGAEVQPESTGRALSLTRRLHVSDRVAFTGGLMLAGGGALLARFAPGTTVVALMALAVGLVGCLPMILRYLLGFAHRAVGHSDDPSARLSVAELRSAPTRSVALLATGTIAAFLAVLIGGSVADVQAAARNGATDLLSSATLWVKPGGPENVYTTQPFDFAETQKQLQRLGVVSSVRAWRDSFLDLPHRRVWVLGVPVQQQAQIAPTQLIEGSLKTADRRIQEGGWAAVSKPIASEEHLHIGQAFTLPTPAGQTRFRLAATIANYGWLPGAIVINAAEHARLWSSRTASELAVNLKPGVAIPAGKRSIEQALPGHALSVKTASERRAEVSAVLGSTLSRLNDTTVVVLIATIASVIAMMVAAIWQRRGRLDSLISIGMSRVQFARLVSYETGLILLTGCLLGIAAGLLGQDLIDGWLHYTTGASVHYQPAWLIGLRTLLIAAGISLLTTLIAVTQLGNLQPRAAFSRD